MKNITKVFISWIPSGAAVVCICALTFHLMHQHIRLSANEIPLQYAEDVRAKLEKGDVAAAVVSGVGTIDMERSLSPFVIVTDGIGNILASTATLRGAYKAPPSGTLAYAKQNKENRVTWQPQQGVRIAAVVLPWSLNGKTGFIIGGQSLSETEQRMQFLFTHMMAGLIVTLVVTFMCTALVQSLKKPSAVL
jgi:hypothetical protein